MRLPQQYWRYAGLPDLLAIALAAFVGALLFTAGLHLLGAWQPPNPAFPLIHAITLGTLLGAPRVAGRLHHARPGGRREPEATGTAQPVLLVGAGDGANLFIRGLAQERTPGYRVIGILSMRSRQAGRRIQGHPILGTADEIAAVLDTHARGEAPARRSSSWPPPMCRASPLERLLDAADRHGVPVRRAPLHHLARPRRPPAEDNRARPTSPSSSAPSSSRTCWTGRRCRSTARAWPA